MEPPTSRQESEGKILIVIINNNKTVGGGHKRLETHTFRAVNSEISQHPSKYERVSVPETLTLREMSILGQCMGLAGQCFSWLPRRALPTGPA